MTREDYANAVKNIMINKCPYGEYHKQNFNTYASYGENAPINSSIINNMPDSKIVLSDSVYEMLIAVVDVTVSTYQEIPFFLYGNEIGNNQIEFKEFMSSSSNRQNMAASFDQNMLNNLEEKVKNNSSNNLVVCHGHSHPPIGNLHENFSLGDFVSYMQMNEDNAVFKNKEVELTGCVVTSSGDINFVFYDNVSQNFYRFTNVVVRDKNNNYIPVNCYGLNQTNLYNNISYRG